MFSKSLHLLRICATENFVFCNCNAFLRLKVVLQKNKFFKIFVYAMNLCSFQFYLKLCFQELCICNEFVRLKIIFRNYFFKFLAFAMNLRDLKRNFNRFLQNLFICNEFLHFKIVCRNYFL